MRLVSVGEVLWDVIGSQEYLGGAPFNMSAHLARLGHDVILASGVGDDDRGRRILERMRLLGLSSSFVRIVSNVSTGFVTVQVDSDGQPAYTIHRPAAYDLVKWGPSEWDRMISLRPEWIYFGTLAQLATDVRMLTKRLLKEFPTARRFYDLNLRRDAYTPLLVRELLSEASIVKLNEEEFRIVSEWVDCSSSSPESFCRDVCGKFQLQGVCVTRGARGAALLLGGEYREVSAAKIQVMDTIGAGDAFAAALIHGIDSGWPLEKVAKFASQLGGWVAAHSGAIPDWNLEKVCALPVK